MPGLKHAISRPLVLSLLCSTLLPAVLAGQPAARRPLDHDAYARWKTLDAPAISPDGRWALYVAQPQEGDGRLHVRAVSGDQAYAADRGTGARFTEDGRFVIFRIRPADAQLREARRNKQKPEEMPKDSLGILRLDTGELLRVPRVKSFQLPEEASGWLAYHLEAGPRPDSARADSAAGSGKEKQRKETGSTLVLRALESGTESRFEDVHAYAFSKDGRRLAYATATASGGGDGVFVVTPGEGGARPVLLGRGDYRRLAVSEAGERVAFLTNRATFDERQPAFELYAWREGQDSARAVFRTGEPALPAGWWVSEHGEVRFSPGGGRLFFGAAPRPAPAPEEELPEEEQVKVDVWNWKDPYLQPMQLARLEEERKRSYSALVHLSEGRVVLLASPGAPVVSLSGEGDGPVAIAAGDSAYRTLISWDYPAYQDVYLVRMEDGRRTRILEKSQARVVLSPEGRFAAWFDPQQRAWFGYDVASGRTADLTGGLPVAFHDEEHDAPSHAPPYGSAGWTAGDRELLVYDRHDVWALDPAGRAAPRSLTEGTGRAERLRFRVVDLDAEEPALPRDEPLLLSAFDLTSKAAGFYRDRVEGDRPPERLIMEARSFSAPVRAEEDDRLVWTRGSFREFPDLWTSGPDFRAPRRLSDVNPQQSEYRWGSVELVRWRSADGEPLEGLLYRPEGFDPARKYPMLVNFYERSSDLLHRHLIPEPHRSTINYPFYASRGYLVFVPDIPYRVGYPGESAVSAVVPGVLGLIAQGFVDEARIGVQGHSWGGYQVAYLITQTNLFRAAEAGAPVANMTSAYGGIRWESGMSRMFQYERTQSRIGGSLWEAPMRYIENSPLFFADKIETPLLILHNDQDGAVPWEQGIELFVALRRLGKPVWMLNYNGEPHWPTKWPNKKDFATRMQQYFDHFLLDAPMPAWMEAGVPALLKGQTLGLEPAGE